MKKVLVISSSLRAGSNSDMLADAFIEGATAAGHAAEKISLRGKTINFCRGCFACQKTQRCVQRDDADAIARKMLEADVLCFATPIYYYAVSGQLKTMLDRANPLFSSDYAFREVYLLAAAADTEDSALDGARKDLEGWVSCFPKARLAGALLAGGVTNASEIKGRSILDTARGMGRSI